MWFLYLLFSVASSFGISIALNKKGDEWPVSIITGVLRKILSFHSKLPKILDCAVCMSFWITLLTDIVIRFIFASNYFLWPLSGFITLGITYVVIDVLDSLYLLGSQKDEK